MDVVRLQNLSIECIIGVNPEEQGRSQKVILDLELFLNLENAGKHDILGATVDYASIAEQAAFLLQEGRFGLLESAGLSLAAFLLAPPCENENRPQVEEVSISLRKPEALPNAIPSIRLRRDRAWLQIGREYKDFGTVDILFETPQMGLYRLHIKPHASIPWHVHKRMHESELVLTDGLLCQNQAAARNSVRRWKHDEPHIYENPSDSVQSILCIDRPPFISEDEIRMDAPQNAVQG